MTWSEVETIYEHQDCLRTDQMLTLNDQFWLPDAAEDASLIFPIADVIFEEVADLHEQPQRQREVIHIAHEGLSSFWYSLAAMGRGHLVLPKDRGTEEQERRTRPFAQAMCRWWDSFCKLDGRYINGSGVPYTWPYWFGGLAFFTPYANLDELRLLQGVPMETMRLELVKLLERNGIDVVRGE